MGRKRVIDRARMLDAIETVIVKAGLQGLTLDAVARECGVSKASVLYDFESKAGLLEAFVRSRLDDHWKRLETVADERAGTPNALLQAMLGELREEPTEEDVATAVIVSLGVNNSSELRQLVRQDFQTQLARVEAEAIDPRSATLAYFALQGIAYGDYFGFNSLTSEQREKILADISQLCGAPPPARG